MDHPVPFRRVGTGILRCGQLQAATSAGKYFGRFDLGACYSQWGMRVRLNGAGTSGSYQLCGSIATSSDANSVLRPMTTFDLAAQSSDDTIWITGKPATSIVIQCTTPSSSGTTLDVFVAASL